MSYKNISNILSDELERGISEGDLRRKLERRYQKYGSNARNNDQSDTNRTIKLNSFVQSSSSPCPSPSTQIGRHERILPPDDLRRNIAVRLDDTKWQERPSNTGVVTSSIFDRMSKAQNSKANDPAIESEQISRDVVKSKESQSSQIPRKPSKLKRKGEKAKSKQKRSKQNRALVEQGDARMKPIVVEGNLLATNQGLEEIKEKSKKKKEKKHKREKLGKSEKREKKLKEKLAKNETKSTKSRTEQGNDVWVDYNRPSSAVVVPPSVAKPSRWEIEERHERPPSQRGNIDPRLQSTVTIPTIFSQSIDRPISPPRRDDHPPRRTSVPRSSYSRHSLPPPRYTTHERERERERERYWAKPKRAYSGYEYKSRSRSPLSPEENRTSTVRPSPPKDMPEHIRWLHERWSKYDRSFFTGGRKGTNAEKQRPAVMDSKEFMSRMNDSRPAASKIDASAPPRRRIDSNDSRRSDERETTGNVKAKFSMPYYQFRKGGVYESCFSGRQQLMTLKEFIVAQPGDLADDPDEAMRLYEEYKLEYKRRTYADFFQAHQDDEWFLEKYHPFYKLLVRGWMEQQLDMEQSRRVRKLIDACIVLLEGGDESDLNGLSDLDYILEEKKEEALELERLRAETEAKATAEEEHDEEGEEKRKPKVSDDEDVYEEKHDANELEMMQHARDYSLYVKQHLKEENIDISDEPDLLSVVETKTKYVGDGMFVQELVASTSGDAEETSLHKASAVLIKNIPSFAKRQDLEEMCRDAHGGFLRLYISNPDPLNCYQRYGIASFWSNANLQKVCWAMRGSKIGAFQLSVCEYRDFHRKRLALVDCLAADKSVVLRDIQLCKSLIEYLDKKYRLWEQASDAPPSQPPKMNPLMVNLDECLAFHLQQLIDSGRLGLEKKSMTTNVVDRDANLTKILDRLILYLRIVHSVDYYGCGYYEMEDDEPKRIGIMHIRGPESCSRTATPKNLTSYIKEFETKLKDVLPQETRLSDEHVQLLGKRSADEEIERYVRANIVAAEEQGMAQCCMCLKRFTSQEFARRHILERHEDRFEEIKWIVVCFNNYLADPNRPCNVQVASKSD